MNYIKSYCRIDPGRIWLNGKDYFKSPGEPFVMDDFLNVAYKHIGIDYRKFFKMDVLSKLGFLASEILLAGSDKEQPKPDMGIIFFNKSSSLEADRNYQKTIQDEDNFFPSPAEFVYTLPNIVTGEIAIRNKIYGETVFYTRCSFTGDTICPVIDDTLNYGGMNYVLGGWVEVDAFENDFKCLMMLCASEQGKTAIEKSESYLPGNMDDVYHNENVCFDEFYVGDLYGKI